MTRIYTNIPSMTARTNLYRNMGALETSLERLSTGLRINSGKDDPAGLIASEILRSDITGIKTAIKNTERANMMIATADSALNEVTNLLNDIRGLVTEAANTGAMSAEMIKANQLQVDASLMAIDRIAAQTTFMGGKLLDGTLDFDLSGVNRNDLAGLTVNQVTFGTDKSPINVNIEVRSPAEQAELYYNNPVVKDDIILTWGGSYGYANQSFSKGATVEEIAKAVNASTNTTGVTAEVGSDAIYGSLYTSSLGQNNDIIITSGIAGEAGGNIEIKYLKGDSQGIFVDYQESLGAGSPATLFVYLQTEEYQSAIAKEVDTSSGVNDNNALKFTANIKGDQYNNANIQYVNGQDTQVDYASKIADLDASAKGAYAYYNDVATKASAVFGNINGRTGDFANLTDPGDHFTIQAKAGGSDLNNVAINFVLDNAGNDIPAGKKAYARYDVAEDGTKRLNIYYKATGDPSDATFADIQAALALTSEFELVPGSSDMLSKALTAADAGSGKNNTHNSGGDAGTLFIVLDKNLATPQGDETPPAGHYTANDIAALFDLDNPASRGSERAASLFNVERTNDNDGTGPIMLYDYKRNAADTDTVGVTSSFQKAFKDGVTGGNVISTAADVVTALNNSAFWGTTMLCPEILAQLAVANANGEYADPVDASGNPLSPPVTARLAPGNTGSGIVSVFEEVAYYGDPNLGTGLQFLGENCSPNIRFVVDTDANGREIPNSELRIDSSQLTETVDFASAVLSARNANASIVITANKKGEDYDDVQFLYKRAPEGVGIGSPDKAGGWVEYDPAESFSEAQVLLKTTDGTSVANSAFFVTATERGDTSNDVAVMFAMNSNQADPIVVTFDEKTKQLRVSLSAALVDPAVGSGLTALNVNDVIAAINNADVGFDAQLSYAEQTNNDGSGTFAGLGLKNNVYTELANTGDSGGHTGGTVTVWLTDQDDGAGGSREPNANDIIRLINNDQVIGQMFNARVYSSGEQAGTGLIDFTTDTGVVTGGGLVEKGILTVHLATDSKGLVTTTAKELVEWWDTLDPELVDNISASLVRPPGAVWDECDDPYGDGILEPTIRQVGDCDEWEISDIQFVGWDDYLEKQGYVETYAKGTMTSDNGNNSSYDLIARRTGPDYNGYKIVYINDTSITGQFADNYVTGADDNPCDDDDPTLNRNDCGELVSPQSSSHKGLYLDLDENTKTINIYIRDGVTTAYDIEQLIESDPYTRGLFEVEQHGDGSGVVTMQDNTILTDGGSLCPGKELNGAKMLFGSDATDYFLIFRSQGYGSSEFVDVKAKSQESGAETSWSVQTADGKTKEKVYGSDIDALVNGVKAVGNGLSASLNTAGLSLDFTLSERAGTDPNYTTSFSIDGGGATYQIGPDVVTSQQITLGIPSINTVQLGGASGKLYQLMSGNDADLSTDTNKAFRIVEESIVAVTSIRGLFGTIQKATFETNINVLNDTLESLTAAESQIRDTDFAEETANLTRAQILVQSNISTLGIANQIPNYMLGLLSR